MQSISQPQPVATEQPSLAQSAETEFATLRRLLMGADYEELLSLKATFDNPNQASRLLANVISEAMAIRSRRDGSVADVLGPTIEGALGHAIKRDPKALADVLYPVMGPAIRKSIRETLSQLLEGFNSALEQSLSPRSIGWRIKAWRTGKQYSEIVLLNNLVYQVEQVFLIHRESGLLLQHVSSPMAISKDPDMVSAMLTAIQDFISDSFSVSDEDQLSTLSLGDLTVLVEQGPKAVIAAVVRGNVSTEYRGLLTQALEQTHQCYDSELLQYDGDNTELIKLDAILRPCLKAVKHQQKPKSLPWLGVAVMIGMCVLFGYMGYQYYRDNQEWSNILLRLQQEPGVVVLDNRFGTSSRYIVGLKDPLSRPVDDILAGLVMPETMIDYQWRSYASLDSEIVLRRALESLRPPPTVALNFDQGRLTVRGECDSDWLRQLQLMAPMLAGVSYIDTQQLTVIDSSAQALNQILDELNAASLMYELAETEVSVADLARVDRLAQTFAQGVALLEPQRQTLRLVITGYADAIGPREANQKIAQRRAETIKAHLVAKGVPANVIGIATHVASENKPSVSDETQRKITVQAQVFSLF